MSDNNELPEDLKKLVGDMFHELNNPLMVISGNAYLAGAEEIENVTVKNYLKVIGEEAKKVQEVVKKYSTILRPPKNA